MQNQNARPVTQDVDQCICRLCLCAQPIELVAHGKAKLAQMPFEVRLNRRSRRTAGFIDDSQRDGIVKTWSRAILTSLTAINGQVRISGLRGARSAFVLFIYMIGVDRFEYEKAVSDSPVSLAARLIICY